MATILNRSTHPVEVKRIELKVWTTRAEVEEAIDKRIKQNGENCDLSDLEAFYSKAPNIAQSAESSDEESDSDDNLDANGNPMDEEALAMAAAMGEDESDEESDLDDEQDQPEDTEDPTEENDSADENDLSDQSADSQASENGAKLNTQVQLERFAPQKFSHGFALLADINMEYALLFTRESFIPGQSIAMEFLIPQRFIISAEVIRCSAVSNQSKVISETKPKYRLQCFFTYNYEGERTKLREFLQSIEPEIPPPPKKISKPEDSDDDDDDFDDLGL